MSDGKLWNSSMPRKGWVLENVEDLEDLIGSCDWCGTSLRYAHHISHPDGHNTIAGCACAEKLTEDYTNPRRIEKALKKRSKWLMSSRWKNRGMWARGGYFWRGDEQIRIDNENGQYRLWINAVKGGRLYNSIDDAKKAAFDAIHIKGWKI